MWCYPYFEVLFPIVFKAVHFQLILNSQHLKLKKLLFVTAVEADILKRFTDVINQQLK